MKETMSIMNGRKVNQKYPLIEKLIFDIENPPNGWMKEALQFILIETLHVIYFSIRIIPYTAQTPENMPKLETPHVKMAQARPGPGWAGSGP